MRLIKIPTILLLLFFSLSSCVNNLNFDDTDLNLKPIFTTPLFFFELNQNDFFDEINNVEVLEINSVIGNFDILQSGGVRDNLETVVFKLEISNEFDRNIIVNLEFLDDLDNVTYKERQFTVLPNDNNFEKEIPISISVNPMFLNSTRISVNLRMISSSVIIDPSVPRSFEFKSKGTYYLNI